MHVLAHLGLHRLNSDAELSMLIRKDVVDFISDCNHFFEAKANAHGASVNINEAPAQEMYSDQTIYNTH